MEEIVALRVTLTSGEERFFLTWGRLFGSVDPAPLVDVVSPHLGMFALGGEVAEVEVCDALREAASERFFFEELLKMARKAPPDGPEYEQWAARMRERLNSGKELHYLGRG